MPTEFDDSLAGWNVADESSERMPGDRWLTVSSVCHFSRIVLHGTELLSLSCQGRDVSLICDLRYGKFDFSSFHLLELWTEGPRGNLIFLLQFSKF